MDEATARSWKDHLLAFATGTSIGREKVFRRIYHKNRWGSGESLSGVGSDLSQTAAVRRELPSLLSEYQVRSVLDAPCGDLYWLKRIEGLDLERYIGIDIVAELVKELSAAPPILNAEFLKLDVVKRVPPKADLVMCRDLLVHLNYEQIWQTLRNFRDSGAEFLLTTTFPEHGNAEIVSSRWRPVNLSAKPFNFPAPLRSIVEGSTQRSERRRDGYSDKALALWRIDSLPL